MSDIRIIAEDLILNAMQNVHEASDNPFEYLEAMAIMLGTLATTIGGVSCQVMMKSGVHMERAYDDGVKRATALGDKNDPS